MNKNKKQQKISWRSNSQHNRNINVSSVVKCANIQNTTLSLLNIKIFSLADKKVYMKITENITQNQNMHFG